MLTAVLLYSCTSVLRKKRALCSLVLYLSQHHYLYGLSLAPSSFIGKLIASDTRQLDQRRSVLKDELMSLFGVDHRNGFLIFMAWTYFKNFYKCVWMFHLHLCVCYT